MTKLPILIAVSLFIWGSLHAAEIKNIQHAINVSGKQRMLTQRILLDYVMIGMNSNFRNPKQDLHDTIKEYDNNLENIRKYSLNKNIKLQDEILEAKNLWSNIKQQIKKPPTKESCIGLSQDLNKLLKESNDIVQVIKQNSDSKSEGVIVDISGRQRMLSQKIAGTYLLSLWAEDKMANKNLEDAMKLFEEAMKKLYTYERNTQEIMSLLKKAEHSYQYVKQMRSSGLPMATMPALVWKKMNDVFVYMDKATGLYAKLQ